MNISRIFNAAIVALALVVGLGACTATVRSGAPMAASKPLPPGQAKKLYGHQSAKAFAPGHQKKKGPATAQKKPAKKNGQGKKK